VRMRSEDSEDQLADEARRRKQRPSFELPRFLLTREEAARALGMSLRHFQRHVQPYLPCVYSGQLRLYRPEDLRQWAEGAAVLVGAGAAS
jgi:AraC-like DNA-binding protein